MSTEKVKETMQAYQPTPTISLVDKAIAELLDMDLELEATEKSVGALRADIVCRNQKNSSRIVIENQRRMSDHSHLGQVLTYAVGLNASTSIWIAEDFRYEHLEVLHWLNNRTDSALQFFGVKFEVLQIGDPPHVPVFKIVSKPDA